MKIIDLLNKIVNGEEVPMLIKWNDDEWYYTNNILKTYSNDKEDLFSVIDGTNLNDEVEILEEENELHANSIEFNINNDKRDCIITLDENDLGIDKLHLDNCYFYKENNKWYVKKYDFKTIELEEEKKIPEKLNLDTDELRGKETPRAIDYLIESKINQVIDYLKSKGE